MYITIPFGHPLIAPDKRVSTYFSLFLHKNMCCGYSLEVPHRGAYNEYTQSMFSCRTKKKYQDEKCALSGVIKSHVIWKVGYWTLIGIASPQDVKQTIKYRK